MNSVESVASHNLTFDEDGVIINSNTGAPFDIARFSDMKYGNRAVTRQFAHALIDHVIEARPNLVEEESPPRLVVPFSVVPPTPFYLSRYALEVVDVLRAANGYEPGNILRIDKSRTQTSNYAAMSHQQRIAECDSIDYFFANGERPTPDSPVVILDDIRITGTVIEHLLGVFEGHTANRIMLGFVACFDPKQALEYPTVEDHINGTNAKTIETILPTILADNFDLTIRTLKLILSTDSERLMPFLERCPPELVGRMLRDTFDSGADFVRYHQMGYRCLRVVAKQG